MPIDELRFPGKNIQIPEFIPTIPSDKKKIKRKPKPLDPNLKKCPNCGKIQNKNNKICERCGLDFNIEQRIFRIIDERCSSDDKILIIADNKKFQLLESVLKNKYYNNLKILNKANCEELFKVQIPEETCDEISLLIDLNKSLNEQYNIPIYNNIYSSRYLANLTVLNSNVEYIEYDNIEELDNFIKAFQEYIYLSNILDITHNNLKDLNSIIEGLLLTEKNIHKLNDYIKQLYDIYDLYGITISNSLNKDIKLVEDVKILYEHPTLIDNENEINTFLNLLQDYNKLNNKSRDSSYYIKSFKNKNRFIQEIIREYNKYITRYNIDTSILHAKQKFDSYGFNLFNLLYIKDFKEIMSSFNDSRIIENTDYLLLNEKFNEYLHDNSIGFSDNFNKYRKKLEKLIKSKIKEKNNHSKKNNEIYKLFNRLDWQLKELSINVDTLDDFEKNINNINLLITYPKVMEDYKLYWALSTFNKNEKDKNITLTFKQYFNRNYGELLKLFNIFFTIYDKKYKTNPEKFDTDNLKEQIVNVIEKTNNFEDKLDNSTYLIKKCYDLKNELNLNEYKKKIDKISKNNRIFKEINSYIDLTKINETISDLYKYKFDIKITSLYDEKVFDDNTMNRIKTLDIESKINNLNNTHKKLNNLLKQKNKQNLKYKKFTEFSSNNYINTNYSKKLLKKLKNCNITNFNKTIDDLKKEIGIKTNDYKFNEIISDMNLIKEINDLSSKLKINDYKNLFNYNYNQLIQFNQKIKKNIEFTNYYNKGLFNDNIFKFYKSPSYLEDLNDLDHRLYKIKMYIEKNNIPYSIFNELELKNIENIIIMKDTIEETTTLFENKTNNISQDIQNFLIIIDNLIKLCGDYPVMDNNELYLEKLHSSQNKINKYYTMNSYETKIDSHERLIKNNLNNIWKGYSTNLNKIKSKLGTDLNFTKLYQNKIFSSKTIENSNKFSKTDYKMLNKIKSNITSLFIKIYKDDIYSSENIYSTNEKLIKEIDKLKNTNSETEYVEIFSELNKILQNNDIENLIKILKIKINQPQNYDLIIKLENQLNNFSEELKYTEDTLNEFCDNIKYTQLINLEIINDNLNLIKNDLNNFLDVINKFNKHRILVMERIYNMDEYDLKTNFDLILSEKHIFLLNKNKIHKKLSNEYINQFDKYIIFNNYKDKKIQNILRRTDRLYNLYVG